MEKDCKDCVQIQVLKKDIERQDKNMSEIKTELKEIKKFNNKQAVINAETRKDVGAIDKKIDNMLNLLENKEDNSSKYKEKEKYFTIIVLLTLSLSILNLLGVDVSNILKVIK